MFLVLFCFLFFVSGFLVHESYLINANSSVSPEAGARFGFNLHTAGDFLFIVYDRPSGLPSTVWAYLNGTLVDIIDDFATENMGRSICTFDNGRVAVFGDPGAGPNSGAVAVRRWVGGAFMPWGTDVVSPNGTLANDRFGRALYCDPVARRLWVSSPTRINAGDGSEGILFFYALNDPLAASPLSYVGELRALPMTFDDTTSLPAPQFGLEIQGAPELDWVAVSAVPSFSYVGRTYGGVFLLDRSDPWNASLVRQVALPAANSGFGTATRFLRDPAGARFLAVSAPFDFRRSAFDVSDAELTGAGNAVYLFSLPGLQKWQVLRPAPGHGCLLSTYGFSMAVVAASGGPGGDALVVSGGADSTVLFYFGSAFVYTWERVGASASSSRFALRLLQTLQMPAPYADWQRGSEFGAPLQAASDGGALLVGATRAFYRACNISAPGDCPVSHRTGRVYKFALSPCPLGHTGNTSASCQPCAGSVVGVDACLPCQAALGGDAQAYSPEPGACTLCLGQLRGDGTCAGCDSFAGFYFDLFANACRHCAGRIVSATECEATQTSCDSARTFEVYSPSFGFCVPCDGAMLSAYECAECPQGQTPARDHRSCVDVSGGGGGGSQRALAAGLGSAAGAVLLLLCSCCALACCCGVLAAGVLCVVGVGVGLVVVALLAGGFGGAALLVRRARRQYSFDLAAFEGYEGEQVGDGLEREFRELRFGDLTLEKKVGEGAFGRVFLGYWRGTTAVAVKELNVQADEAAKREFIREANVMARVGNHPHVVPFIGAVTTEERFYMVSQFAEKGSLLDVLLREPPPPVAALLRMAGQAARGVAHLHAEGIVHRDLAARNFLVTSHDQVLVTDFGLSRICDSAAEDGARRTQSAVGPVRWMAPESLRAREYSAKSDVWMFGVFLFELATRGALPYEASSVAEVLVGVTERQWTPKVPAAAPSLLADAMRACWQQDPHQRPSMAQLAELLHVDEGISSSASDYDAAEAPPIVLYRPIADHVKEDKI